MQPAGQPDLGLGSKQLTDLNVTPATVNLSESIDQNMNTWVIPSSLEPCWVMKENRMMPMAPAWSGPNGHHTKEVSQKEKWPRCMLSVHTNEQWHDRNTHALTSTHDTTQWLTTTGWNAVLQDSAFTGLWGYRWKIPDFKEISKDWSLKKNAKLGRPSGSQFQGKVYITPLWKSRRKRCQHH